MIPKRIIPVLLLKDGRLVKGTKFGKHVDVGDPVSQAMIFDAQGADEVIIVDISSSLEKKIIDTNIIKRMITNCRLPISAGGGIRNINDARQYFNSGADKIIVNTHALLRPKLIKELSSEFGSQSVVVSVDVKRKTKGIYDIYIYGGKKKIDTDLRSFLQKAVNYGAGEVMITSIGREGTLSGFDLDFFSSVNPHISVPLIASGGAGCYDDIVNLYKKSDVDACGIGKMLFLRDYDIVRIKAYLKDKGVLVREA